MKNLKSVGIIFVLISSVASIVKFLTYCSDEMRNKIAIDRHNGYWEPPAKFVRNCNIADISYKIYLIFGSIGGLLLIIYGIYYLINRKKNKM